jgi:hypothetical protein
MKNTSLAKKTQSWANKIKSYQKKAPALFDEDLKKSDSEFKIDHYFVILDKIELEKGWLVDYLYLQRRLGGEPVIIAYPALKKTEYRKLIDKINDNELDYTAQDIDSENVIDTFLNYDDVDNYLNHVTLDKSEESYLQFVILAALGAQFDLFWHALYNDHEFVCTPEKAEKIINRINRSDEDMGFMEDDLFEEQLKNIDFEPQITVKEDKVQVRLMFFTKWGGFTEAKYQVKKSFPHKIIEKETKTLIDYNCGYLY